MARLKTSISLQCNWHQGSENTSVEFHQLQWKAYIGNNLSKKKNKLSRKRSTWSNLL